MKFYNPCMCTSVYIVSLCIFQVFLPVCSLTIIYFVRWSLTRR